MKAASVLALAAVSLAACARNTRVYPSLAPRAVEREGFAEPVRAVPVATPDPPLDARIAGMQGDLTRLAAAFAADARKAEAEAERARGAAAGNDSWLEAQTALAQLDDWRAQTSSLLTDVDTLSSDRAARLLPPYSALATLRDAVAAESGRQNDTIARIQARLAPA